MAPTALRRNDGRGIVVPSGEVGNSPFELPMSMAKVVAIGRGGEPGGGWS
jgi:hypothetical protein